jgi:putative proteasome-type protease
MTYCLGILLPTGLVLAADSRSNAGVDQIALARKMRLFNEPEKFFFAILSAGNLATTQSVVTQLQQATRSGDPEWDMHAAKTLFDVASIVGAKLREVVEKDSRYVQPYGDPSGSFLVGGQMAGEEPRLFQVYSAGNIIEASNRSRFLQIGETKYGKPILDRVLDHQTSLDEAAKLAMLSFDATIRSNLSVGPPIDLLRYQIDSFSTANLLTVVDGDPYWTSIKRAYADGLGALVDTLPCPPPAAEA